MAAKEQKLMPTTEGSLNLRLNMASTIRWISRSRT